MPGQSRDPARTRRTVLDAAATTVASHGAGVSLDVVARRAGVSKAGLLHHFPTRDQLLLALARDLTEQFHAAVHAAVDPRDRAEGRVVRGYVNATFDALDDDSSATDFVVLTAALAAIPGVQSLLAEDKRRWDRLFADDGLHPDRVVVITRAADGASVAHLYEGGVDRAQLGRTRELLLALSRDNGPCCLQPARPDSRSAAWRTVTADMPRLPRPESRTLWSTPCAAASSCPRPPAAPTSCRNSAVDCP
jgi:AcrR family transcriptional regulator